MSAPPVYRPQLQAKPKATIQRMMISQGPDLIKTVPLQLSRAVIQLVQWEDDEFLGLIDFTQSRDGESDEQTKVERIKGELTPLSKFSGVTFNCYGWALGYITFDDPGSKLSAWKHRLGNQYNFLDEDDSNATILLWGRGQGDDSEILHASVRLTHEQLKARKAGTYKNALSYDQPTLNSLPDPFWSSAMGFGFGIAAHPKYWFRGGDFGQPVAGMKPK